EASDTESNITAGQTSTWSSSGSITGGNGGTLTCQIASVSRTASNPQGAVGALGPLARPSDSGSAGASREVGIERGHHRGDLLVAPCCLQHLPRCLLLQHDREV